MKVAVVEDEAVYRDRLKHYLERYQTESGQKMELSWFRDGCEIAEDI